MKKIFTIIAIAALLITAGVSCDKTIHVANVVFPRTVFTVDIGRTFTIPVLVFPPDAADKSLTWKSNNPNVATVDQDGKVTAIAAGWASITATSVDGNRQAICHITVIDLPEIEMVFVEGGTFMMGCTGENCNPIDEFPIHQVTLSNYHISKYLVTQKLWEAVMEYNFSYFKGANLPVEQVSWDDAQNFINQLNMLTGKNYSLPTEAQWEFAARGGNESEGYEYSGSNNVDEVAWHYENSGYTTHPVGMKKPNELGIYDMSGNVFEWCNDRYGLYTDEAQTNPQGSDEGYSRICRGGGWYDKAEYGRVSKRGASGPQMRYSSLGFRLVLSE